MHDSKSNNSLHFQNQQLFLLNNQPLLCQNHVGKVQQIKVAVDKRTPVLFAAALTCAFSVINTLCCLKARGAFLFWYQDMFQIS